MLATKASQNENSNSSYTCPAIGYWDSLTSVYKATQNLNVYAKSPKISSCRLNRIGTTQATNLELRLWRLQAELAQQRKVRGEEQTHAS
jgi:hypothetical protein